MTAAEGEMIAGGGRRLRSRGGRVSEFAGFQVIGPLTYQGKVGCMNVTCTRRSADGFGPEIPCFGWHCCYCDEPCSYQGHNCDAADAVLGEAKRQLLNGGG